jgi:hypothetical protein
LRHREVWVAGFPGHCGGGETELDHLIDLWRARGVDVHLVPMFSADSTMVESAHLRGCHVHRYYPAIFADRIVVSFCNENFLAQLPKIMAAGRPEKVIWFNCMTWLFDGEKRAVAEGWIDLHGFVSAYQEQCLGPLLRLIGGYATFGYWPYFNTARVRWRYRDWNGSYCVGRISRDDPSKYATNTWDIFDQIRVPRHLIKRVFVLGLGPRTRKVLGPPPAHLRAETWPCNAIPSESLYRRLDTMVHKTGTSRESYCRVLIEAYAHGVVPIVEDDYAFPDLVLHGETGYRTSDSEEMSSLAGELAHDPDKHKVLAENGRRHLETVLIDADACWEPWESVL